MVCDHLVSYLLSLSVFCPDNFGIKNKKRLSIEIDKSYYFNIMGGTGFEPATSTV